MSEANKKLVREFVKALEALDMEKFLSFLDDDVLFVTTGQHAAAGTKTKAQVAKELPAMREMLPGGFRFTEVSMTAEGDRVTMELRGQAKTVTGEDYNNEYCHFYQIRDGKIIIFRDYMDSALVERLMLPFLAAHGATAVDREREATA